MDTYPTKLRSALPLTVSVGVERGVYPFRVRDVVRRGDIFSVSVGGVEDRGRRGGRGKEEMREGREEGGITLRSLVHTPLRQGSSGAAALGREITKPV